MRPACSPSCRILLLTAFIGSHILLIGCTDDSKTSGTMVEVSEEAKAQLKAKRESYKGGPPAKATGKTTKR